ncbi:energy-coupling factor ABC transporter ATP-binding protein [Neobacillus vireti]|uniref:Cobalt transporter ATP-binding subunit n=1 Tax=Neobacillus vireti LMG 21834 TaxID=1131730 RepID=A0AB94IUW6_9BACI|nr:ATP-binding cassette domain-containing protein [Neobacillus vireti]ETI70817.1 cobalt transporter ATP-binding subunit [Neobacillus vireti LMG 21834]KLT17645.1 cobalt ABC transporter ATP-binding protein [Neobacillus vireti]
MIKIANLSFSYNKETRVLSGINLEFDRRSTAIIGQNGAGKTTLVKLMKGLLKADEGKILIHEHDVSGKTAAQLARTIGLVFQNPNDQIFKRTVLDEVMFGPLNIKMDKQTAKEKAIEALKMVELDDKLEMNPHDLSLSEKKLLCIASVVAMDTDIIIFDEPTIAQDHGGKEKIRQIIQALKDKNKLVMTIIHDMDFVAENFERTIVFNDGQVLLDGETRDVFSQKELLKTACVEAPGITKLAERLGFKDTVLTVDEFINMKKTYSPPQ